MRTMLLAAEHSLVHREVGARKAAEHDLSNAMRLGERTPDGRHGHLGCGFDRVAIDAGADVRIGDALRSDFARDLERSPVALCKQFRLTTRPASPLVPDGM